ncbi:hypothetical protein [Microbacterium sp. PRC9]|uniref:hypothetical protein n=1 Tax=Microbacterium sp. PRC9 TaxID=2962591 RepID=UPI002882CA36|nr:hypothetical protein [Microbacterium sp. PRC9]MDT0143078.1 hypothetical protein [Microbacterium sp. PRC9]
MARLERNAEASAPVRLCAVESVECHRPVMSPSAAFCRFHAMGIAESFGIRTAAQFEEKLNRERQKLDRLARLGRRR